MNEEQWGYLNRLNTKWLKQACRDAKRFTEARKLNSLNPELHKEMIHYYNIFRNRIITPKKGIECENESLDDFWEVMEYLEKLGEHKRRVSPNGAAPLKFNKVLIIPIRR
jgi:hypothetical protein